MKTLLKYILIIFFSFTATSQNTVGTTLNSAGSLEGYTLITPTSNVLPTYTYLIDNCGRVVNSWESNFKGQGADIIMPDGSLYRGAFDDQSTLTYPGNNGRLEHYDWDGNLIWGYTHSATDYSFHHDYHVLSNGNILMLVAERKTLAEAIQAGRDPSKIPDGDLYTEKIIEIQPVGVDSAIIVWEWDLWDHLVQNFDNTKDNFGVVADTPRKLNINFSGFSNDVADWTHMNSLDYNETFDQIVFSSRFMSEFYVIDHSTTTAEAATSSGGNSGFGGDFLYRWGNPQAYDQGTASDQKLYGQHTVHWIPNGMPDAGKLMVFNNGFNRGYSSVEFIVPPADAMGNYSYTPGTSFGPTNAIIRYQEATPTDFFAPFLSSAYQLSNGNILVDKGPVGQLVEVNTSNQVVWEYISPVLMAGTTLSQGDTPGGINSRFFRASRYEANYIGFNGRDLTPGSEIEQNPQPGNCALLSIADVDANVLNVYPNPVDNLLYIENSDLIVSAHVFEMNGKEVFKTENVSSSIDLSELQTGIYFIKFTSSKGVTLKKIVKN